MILACNPAIPFFMSTATPTATSTPTVPPTPTLPPTATLEPPDTGWQFVTTGVEVRSLNVELEERTERVTLARLNPASVFFRVLYSPGTPQLVQAWAAQSGALLVLNAGYFTEEYLATGLLVSNGEQYGSSYDDFAGMFTVTKTGVVSVRWLRSWPYDPTEPLQEAVQCFPVVVKPGNVMGFPADADDGRPARRTVVAQDRNEHILFLIAPRGYFSLHALAVWLTESDLDVDVALNLDGGPSSGFWVTDSAASVQINSLSPVPAVLAVFPH